MNEIRTDESDLPWINERPTKKPSASGFQQSGLRSGFNFEL